MSEFHCFNPLTGKHDGGYCGWGGKGKCRGCQAGDRIAELEAEVEVRRQEVAELCGYECWEEMLLEKGECGY